MLLLLRLTLQTEPGAPARGLISLLRQTSSHVFCALKRGRTTAPWGRWHAVSQVPFGTPFALLVYRKEAAATAPDGTPACSRRARLGTLLT
eukprot:2918145-Pyramimonas_sp.AAC.1